MILQDYQNHKRLNHQVPLVVFPVLRYYLHLEEVRVPLHLHLIHHYHLQDLCLY